MTPRTNVLTNDFWEVFNVEWILARQKNLKFTNSDIIFFLTPLIFLKITQQTKKNILKTDTKISYSFFFFILNASRDLNFIFRTTMRLNVSPSIIYSFYIFRKNKNKINIKKMKYLNFSLNLNYCNVNKSDLFNFYLILSWLI